MFLRAGEKEEEDERGIRGRKRNKVAVEDDEEEREDKL